MAHPATEEPHFRIGVMTLDVEGRSSEDFHSLVDAAVKRFRDTLKREERVEVEVIPFAGPHFTPHAGGYSPLDFFEIGYAEKAERAMPFLLMVTEVDLTATRMAYTLAWPSQLTNIAILSTKRLDPAFWGEASDRELAIERLSLLLLHSFGHLVNLPKARDPQNVMHRVGRVEDLDRMTGLTDAQWEAMGDALPREAHERRTGSNRPTFIASMLLRDAPEIARAIIGANPFRLLLKLPTMIAAGLSIIIVLLFSAETWDVASTVSVGQVATFAGVSIAAALYVLYRAFALDTVMGRDRYLTETTVVTVAVTVLSLLLTLLILFVALGLLMYGAIIAVFPQRLMATWPTVDPAVRVLDHLKLSIFLAAMGVLGGSLGGRSDSRDIVRSVLFLKKEE